MSVEADSRPPAPSDRRLDDLDDPFWEACREGRLLVHRCTLCDRAYWPASSCAEHGSAAMRWQEASGKGTLHTWVTVELTHDPYFARRVPYNAAVIRLAEGVLFHSSIVDCDPEQLALGLDVEVVFDDDRSGEALPRFRPARSPGPA